MKHHKDVAGEMLHETPSQLKIRMRILDLNTARSHERVRPYMPALLLIALELAMKGRMSWLPFEYVEHCLADFLARGFGINKCEAKYPFWYLQHAHNLWEVATDVPLADLLTRKGKKEPLVSELRKNHARGRLSLDIRNAIRQDSAFGRRLQQLLIDGYIAPAKRQQVREALSRVQDV
jgi:hypothetical protein